LNGSNCYRQDLIVTYMVLLEISWTLHPLQEGRLLANLPGAETPTKHHVANIL